MNLSLARRLLIVSTFLLLQGVDVHAQSGLIARYLLNGNASDSIGSNHGTVLNATPTTDRSGQPNAAYYFNGTDSRIEFDSPPPFTQPNNWTVTAWVKPANFTQGGLAVYVGLDNGAASDGFGFGLSGGAALQGFAPDAGGFFTSGQSFPAPAQWAHVVMARTNSTIYFYLNGVRTPNTSATTLTFPTDFTIGSQNGLRFFNGAVDDVRIYNRAITSNEVAQIYSGNEGPCYPHAATAIPFLFNGFVVGATMVDGGCGYTNAPSVTITGGGGSNATATATISNGVVTSVNIVSAGCCYTSEPRIVIGSPPFPASVSLRVSRLMVTQHVMIGRTYVLEGSADLINWATVGLQYVAQSEVVETEVSVGQHQFFRTRQIP